MADVTPDELVARADAFRPRLLEEQAATEERSYYSEETARGVQGRRLRPDPRAAPLRRSRARPADLLPGDVVDRARLPLDRLDAHARRRPTRCRPPRTSRRKRRTSSSRMPVGTSSPRRASPFRTRARSPSTAATASAAPGTSARASPTRRTTCRSCRPATGTRRSSRSCRGRSSGCSTTGAI